MDQLTTPGTDEASLLAEARRLQSEAMGYGAIGKRPGLSKGQLRHLLMREKLKGADTARPKPQPVELDPRSAVDFHPLANLFPLIEDAEFEALVEDIRENGQREDIVLHKGQVLDARNRYRACIAAGISPRVVAFRPDVHGDVLRF